MQTTTHGQDSYARRSGAAYDEVVVADEVRHEDGVPQAARLISLAAGAIVTIIGAFALLKVDWGTAEVDSPVYDVGGMTFTPVTAVVTALLGLILISVAASRASEGKIAMGAVVASIGVALLLVGDLGDRWQTTGSQGWLALAVGLVFVVAGILSERRHVVRRHQRAVHQDVL